MKDPHHRTSRTIVPVAAALWSVLALAAPILLWWTIYWNVFGFQF